MKYKNDNNTLPDYIFETSWEVCNKVGGIYTVLSTRANTMQALMPDHVVFIGPDVWTENESPVFTSDEKLLLDWKKACQKEGLGVRIGRWNVPGNPIAVLVDFKSFFEHKNDIYAEAWNLFGVDSLHAYGDYDEASMFSYAAGRFVEIVYKSRFAKAAPKVLYQAHEWMSGLGMLFLKHRLPQIATIFTTHATSIGRSIAGNNKLLYEYFVGYNGDQMASELSMEAKHSIEKQSAHHADCFTTVSTFTDRECKQLLDKPADVVLPNGFEKDFVPVGAVFTAKRREARRKMLAVASALTGEQLDDNTLIISTSGRNDYRCKGFDVYMQSLVELEKKLKGKAQKVLALIEVPCWMLSARKDLKQRLNEPKATFDTPLEFPFITHDLNNFYEDRIVQTIWSLGLDNKPGSNVKLVFVPCYLEGKDGIFDMPYYDLLAANDLAIYPSYYEPWGYTPLESVAFKTPCITTDLSGFGQWVNGILGHVGHLKEGVEVIHRDDNNYMEVAHNIAKTVMTMLETPAKSRTAMRSAAAKIADHALWSNFIRHYQEAYAFAMKRVQEQTAAMNTQYL